MIYPSPKAHSSVSTDSRDMQPLPAVSSVPVQGTELAQKDPEYLLLQSLSIILPAHNEEQIIGETVISIAQTLQSWVKHFEILVINDGSSDGTAQVLASLSQQIPQLRIITHQVNQGYGAALVSGFEAASTDLAFFMDSDGQFDIHDIKAFFPYVNQYDAVLGYRIDRQDTWMRKLNAWGWKQLVGLVLDVHVKDVDCAFKLYSTSFIRSIKLETRGAMINAEMLYKLKRGNYTIIQVGVHHLPRLSGKATGARPSVIIRAFKELFTYAHIWRNQEKQALRA